MGYKYEVEFWNYEKLAYEIYWKGNKQKVAMEKLKEINKSWPCVRLTVRK